MNYGQSYWENRVKEDLLDNLAKCQQDLIAAKRELREMKDKLTAMPRPNHYILRDTWCLNPSDHNTALWYKRACEQAERADKAEEDKEHLYEALRGAKKQAQNDKELIENLQEDGAAMAEVLRLQEERINDLKAILRDDLRCGRGY